MNSLQRRGHGEAMQLKFHTMDVFTSRCFCGNPLAVVLDADELDGGQMQRIAREFNLSETIFVMKPADSANTAAVRIFFPTGEMPFAGHPTIGCAVLLAEFRHKPGCSFETEIRLEEQAGLVPVTVSRIGDVPGAMFTAPVVPFPVEGNAPSADEMAPALGLAPSDISFEGHNAGPPEGGPGFLFAPVISRAALGRARIIEPHWSAIAEAAGTDGVYLYCRGGERPETSFRARMYAPGAGIAEDPATGSATALLASQLLISGSLKDGANRFTLEQGYEMGRPSDLVMEADVSDGRLKAVRVAGQAVRVSEGTITVD